ncbi:hypothetical protein [Tuwongella immobilis]|uniref:hypothetical protein n=1 Tax=Tuwongella immobilis TaxID=692036 RepID=UPI001E31FAA4|nr:hypothetical protein [Tuwongella immobilis]
MIALICGVLFAGSTGAQDLDSTLFLMVRAGPSLTEQKIEATLTSGLREAKCTIDGRPQVKKISPIVYEEVESLISAPPGEPGAEAAEAINIRTLPTREPISEFRLKSPSQILKSLTVTYEKAGKVTYKPTAPEKNGPLTLIVPGRYGLKLDPADRPLNYDAVISELGKDDETMSSKWPERDQFFVVTMRNFRGSKETLFRVVQNGDLVANPLQNIRLGRDFTFVFANMDSLVPTAPELIEGNELIVQVPAPNGRSPRRVWMMFPLTKEQMAKERDNFRKFTSTELPDEIRKNAILATQPATIAHNTPASWIEIPRESANSRSFLRRLPLEDPSKLGESFPTLGRLLVYEFDNGTPEAIEMQHPTYDRTYVLDEEMKTWASALQRSGKGTPPKKANDSKNPNDSK